MDKIDLHELLKKYPDIFNDKTMLRGLLKDIAPGNILDINLVIQAFEIGIQKQISRSSQVTNADVYRYIKIMEENFGTAEKYAYQAINMWCAAYNKKCPKIEFEDEKKYLSKVKEKDILKPYAKGTIYEDSNVSVIYQGWRNVVYSNTGKAKAFRFIFENRTDKRVRFHFINIEIDGYVNTERTTTYEIDKKKKGQQEFNFIYENKIPEGIDKFTSVEFRLAYQLLNENIDVPFPPHYEVVYEHESDEISIAMWNKGTLNRGS